MESEIVVKGSGRALVMPDRAVLRVEVEADAGSKEEAYRQAAPVARTVDAVIEDHGAEIDRVVAAALVVRPRTRWRRGESVRTGWRASRSTVVEVTGMDGLAELVSALTTAGGAVSGPSWRVDVDNPVYTEVRRLAATDARERATAYAEALGLRLGAVAWVAEPGLRIGGGGGGDRYSRAYSAAPAGAMRDAGEAEDRVIDIAPDEVPVESAVEVGFTFLDASL